MLTVQYIPYTQIDALDSDERIEHLLSHVREDKIVFLEGQLKKNEETELIAATMEQITDKFKGIELATIKNDAKQLPFIKKLLLQYVFGDRQGMTIIGPANIVKEIKRDPDKIQLYLTDNNTKKKKKK